MKVTLSLGLLLLMSVSTTYGMMNFKKVFMMYAYRLVDEMCLGKRASSQFMYDEHYAMDACKAEVHEEFRDIVDQPVTSPTTTTESSFLNANRDEYIEVFSMERIENLNKNNMLVNAMFNCTLKMLNVMTDDMRLDVQSQIEKFQNINDLDQELSTELVSGVRECASIANCLPAVDHSGLDPQIKTALLFGMCHKKRKALACIKHDMKKKTEIFNMEALEGIESIRVSQNSQNVDKLLGLLYMKSVDPQDYMDILSY